LFVVLDVYDVGVKRSLSSTLFYDILYFEPQASQRDHTASTVRTTRISVDSRRNRHALFLLCSLLTYALQLYLARIRNDVKILSITQREKTRSHRTSLSKR